MCVHTCGHYCKARNPPLPDAFTHNVHVYVYVSVLLMVHTCTGMHVFNKQGCGAPSCFWHWVDKEGLGWCNGQAVDV